MNRRRKMKQKSILVTGANAGIGLETARGIAQQGHQVIMVTRSKDKGENARQDVIQSTGNNTLRR